MSNTAERWWVRLAARWLARVSGVSEHLRLAMLGLTGVSTATITLKQYGHGDLAWPFIAITGTLTIVWTYYYTEGGVWNQVSRDRVDMSTNYSDPTMLMNMRLQARQLAYLADTLDTDHDLDTMIQELDALTHDEWTALRDGINIDDPHTEDDA